MSSRPGGSRTMFMVLHLFEDSRSPETHVAAEAGKPTGSLGPVGCVRAHETLTTEVGDMTIETWDSDQALTRGPWDTALNGCSSIDRYGILPEEMAGEPLDIALAQEEAEPCDEPASDEPWLLTDDDEVVLFEADSDRSPEERAMHVVQP